jgi:hypothetical protein
MSPARSDIWAGVGAILSSLVSTYAWLYAIGLVPLFTFIAGACFTLWTQERLEMKRRKREFDKKMTEHVYGPMYKELTSIRASLRGFQQSSGGLLHTIFQDYRFNLVKEDLSRRIKELCCRLPPYSALLNEASSETEIYIGRGLKKHKIEGGVRFVIWSGSREIFSYPLTDPVFEDKSPLDFLTKRAEPYRNTFVIVYVGRDSEGRFSKEHRIHQISLDILKKTRKDPTVQKQRRERELLLKECNELIEAIKEKIVLS